MTAIKPGGETAPPRLPYERLLLVLAPIIAVGTITAAAALAAAIAGFHREEMLVIAAGIAAVLGIPSVILLYRQLIDRRYTVRALRNVEARVGGIVESAMDAIITVDENQKIVLFNRQAEEVFGCPREQALGAPLSGFIPQRFRASHEDLVQRFGQSRSEARRMGHARVVMGLRRNGEEFPIEASISTVTEHGHPFYTVILRDVTERVKAEEALGRSREEIRELALAASTAREQEKSRIARELHDELGQALTALKIDLGVVRERLVAGDVQVRDKLAAMQVLLDGTVAATRRIAADLRPLVLDDLGLVAGTDWLVHNFTNRTGVPCELVIGQGNLELRDPHATTLFRVLQESLTNVARHSDATQVEVILEREGDEIVLTVRDNGRGFCPGDPVRPNSFGLAGLRERAALMSGTVEIESAPGAGTRIEMRLPAPHEEAAA